MENCLGKARIVAYAEDADRPAVAQVENLVAGVGIQVGTGMDSWAYWWPVGWRGRMRERFNWPLAGKELVFIGRRASWRPVNLGTRMGRRR